jgi:hypothetical protein
VGTSKEELSEDTKTKSKKGLFTLKYITVQGTKSKMFIINDPVISDCIRKSFLKEKNGKKGTTKYGILSQQLQWHLSSLQLLVLTTDLPLAIKNSTSVPIFLYSRSPSMLPPICHLSSSSSFY